MEIWRAQFGLATHWLHVMVPFASHVQATPLATQCQSVIRQLRNIQLLKSMAILRHFLGSNGRSVDRVSALKEILVQL